MENEHWAGNGDHHSFVCICQPSAPSIIIALFSFTIFQKLGDYFTEVIAITELMWDSGSLVRLKESCSP